MGGREQDARMMAARLRTAALIALLFIMIPDRAGAQVLPAAAGAVGGLLAGTLVTTATVVFEARLGHFVYGLDEFLTVRPEMLPILVGPIAGAVLGARSPAALGRAGVGAVIGLTAGAAIGTLAGGAIWSTTEGRWAGGIIGSATGMLIGAVLMASTGSGSDDPGAPAATVAFSIRPPWSRR